MKDRPIPFSGPMVRALLDDRKGQTRRVLKDTPVGRNGYCCTKNITFRDEAHFVRVMPEVCPYGRPGDLLWVRETYREHDAGDQDGNTLEYRADRPEYVKRSDDPCAVAWRPPMFMFRRCSRITLRITDVRVQRLRDISEADAIAEGVWHLGKSVNGIDMWAQHDAIAQTTAGLCADVQFIGRTAQDAYRKLWESINGKGSWDANPWVWAISFAVVKQNVDQVMRAAA